MNIGDAAYVMSHAAARPAHSGWLQGVVTGIGLQRPVYSTARNWQWSSLLNVNNDQSAQRD